MEELPKLVDPSFEHLNKENDFNDDYDCNFAWAEAIINGRYVELDCNVWTPALQQDKLDKFLGPSEPIRSLEIRNLGGSSPEVINEFLHRLLS